MPTCGHQIAQPQMAPPQQVPTTLEQQPAAQPIITSHAPTPADAMSPSATPGADQGSNVHATSQPHAHTQPQPATHRSRSTRRRRMDSRHSTRETHSHTAHRRRRRRSTRVRRGRSRRRSHSTRPRSSGGRRRRASHRGHRRRPRSLTPSPASTSPTPRSPSSQRNPPPTHSPHPDPYTSHAGSKVVLRSRSTLLREAIPPTTEESCPTQPISAAGRQRQLTRQQQQAKQWQPETTAGAPPPPPPPPPLTTPETPTPTPRDTTSQQEQWYSWRRTPPSNQQSRETLQQQIVRMVRSQQQQKQQQQQQQQTHTEEDASSPSHPPNTHKPRSATSDSMFQAASQPCQQHIDPIVDVPAHLLPEPSAYHVADAAALTRTLTEIASGTAHTLDQISQFAAAAFSSGNRHLINELHAEIFTIAGGIHSILYIPWNAAKRAPFGVPPDQHPGAVWSYTCAHGTDISAAQGTMRDGFVRPTSIKALQPSQPGMEQRSTVVYGSATLGELCPATLQIVCDRATRRSKGQQGVLILGQVDSKFQHYSLGYRDTWREAHAVGHRGVRRNPDKWGWRAGHFDIKGIGLVA